MGNVKLGGMEQVSACVWLFLCLLVCLLVCLFVCLLACLFVCVCVSKLAGVCLFVYVCISNLQGSRQVRCGDVIGIAPSQGHGIKEPSNDSEVREMLSPYFAHPALRSAQGFCCGCVVL